LGGGSQVGTALSPMGSGSNTILEDDDSTIFEFIFKVAQLLSSIYIFFIEILSHQ
jgi:hypothetical protein